MRPLTRTASTSPLRAALLPVALVLAVLLAGCTGGGDDGGSTDTAAVQKRLDAAKKTIDDAETVDVSLTTSSVPDGVSGLLSAKGKGNHSPAFEGDVKVSSGGATLTAKVIAVDGTVYADTGLTPGYLTIDPASLKAPDPAGLLDPDSGLTSILASTEDLTTGDQSRDGRDVLTSVTGTLPGSVVADIIPSASRQGTFAVTYRLTDDDELRDAKMTGPFYGEGSKVTYTVRLATSDEPVEITAPAATGGR
ncbi:lipoprotein LprG [Aeromicrobium sp. SORGH_AS981]|uniref:LppX_LprAFG lipoprotein n=1 Tax=Aeromicrobium sp. SORGH_AS_0981 TaxID=3041802 RepID=UPI002857D05B|nr:LppX_LprAFG lipoprotein [Aeromicrobium sp. SORGH_AS_0981]MDR6119642.1 lipoprotein LprG [Aeromicrobium sp. SORGH_AS_0981]